MIFTIQPTAQMDLESVLMHGWGLFLTFLVLTSVQGLFLLVALTHSRCNPGRALNWVRDPQVTAWPRVVAAVAVAAHDGCAAKRSQRLMLFEIAGSCVLTCEECVESTAACPLVSSQSPMVGRRQHVAECEADAAGAAAIRS